MAVTTLFALSNPGGKRRIRIRSKTMARRRRRRNPRGDFMKKAQKVAKKRGISISEAMKALAGGKSGGGKKRKAERASKKGKRKGAARKRKGGKKRASKKGKRKGGRKSAKRVQAGKKAARTRARKKAARSAAGRKAARRGKRKGGKKASKRRGKGRKRSYGRRPRKGTYRPYGRVKKGRRSRFGARVKARMAALGFARKVGGKYSLNPRRRRRRKSRASNPRRRRASRRRSRNPRRRRNPVAARRRRSRRRRNPMGIVRGVKGLFSKAKAMRYARLGLGAMLGMAVARQGPQLLSRIPVVGPILNPDSPLKALLASAAAVGAGVLVARKLRVGSDIIAALVAGGAGIIAAGTLKLASQRIPILGRIPGVAGMGDVVSPSQLVAGEAIFGGNSMGDYLQLSGPVPEQYFAGGLNDYVEFQNRAAGAAAEAASAAQVDWSPGVETSF